jgi:hypothetical protein
MNAVGDAWRAGSIPADGGLEHSQIRMLDALFKAEWPGYRLIDYGALDLKDLENSEGAGDT